MGGRRTNLALLLLLAVAFGSGWLAFELSSISARAVLVLHAVSGLAILGLVPWKSALSRRSLRRRRLPWPSILLLAALGGLLGLSILFGVLHSAGAPDLWSVPLVSSLPVVGQLTAMEVHVGAALALLPFLAWHLWRRPVRPRPTDLSRRALLRGGLLAAGGGAGLLLLPSGRRAPTGSYRLEAPAETSWMFDSTPPFEAVSWTLRAGSRAWTYDELAGFDDRVTAVIDCTGGWYAEQEWTGARLSRLLPAGELAGMLSLVVRSATGYWRRFDLASADRLLLATRAGGASLSAGGGAPVRLVVPGWRGFWWVKWVVELSPDPAPWWWQPPYPLQ